MPIQLHGFCRIYRLIAVFTTKLNLNTYDGLEKGEVSPLEPLSNTESRGDELGLLKSSRELI